MKVKLILIFALFCTYLYGQDGVLPIIDMHLHTQTEVWAKKSPCYPRGDCEGTETLISNPSELLELTQEQMNKYNIVLGVLSGSDLDETFRWAEADSRFIVGPLIQDPKDADYQRIKIETRSGKIKVMGEVASAYEGYLINDQLLDPFFKLANENDIPVLVHVHGTGGGNYPIAKVDPILVSEVVKRYPNLRIYLENGGFPYLDKMISLMYLNPNVYADLSTLTWIAPRAAFHKYLKDLVDSGLGKRLMFGSDQMLWPEKIGEAVEAINSADFLSEEQKRDIFYNNAARFLRLSEEDIKKHHGE